MATGVEIPFWIFGQQKWVSGINRNTTCQEVSLTLSHGVILSLRKNGMRICKNVSVVN